MNRVYIMKKPLFTGCGVALVTPFKDGRIDSCAFEKHLAYLLESGVDALFPCGTTGEPACLSEEEWKEVISLTVKVTAGKVPVIAGTGSNNTCEVVRRARIARDLGADAQLCVTPYYNKTTQQGLIAHFKHIADQDILPVFVYNVPSRTGMDISLDTYRQLTGHQNIIGIKDASGSYTNALSFMHALKTTVPFYSGEDQLAAPLRAIGYSGVISVTANVAPQLVVRLCHAEIKEACELQTELYELNRLMFVETSPIPVKAALSMMGRCENELRLPLLPMSVENAGKLKEEMKRLGLIC